jgi:serine protease Do
MKKIYLIFGTIFLSLSLGVCSFASSASLRALSDAFTSVGENATPCVVSIKGIPNQGGSEDPYDFFSDEFFKRFFGLPQQQPKAKAPPPPKEPVLLGSGFIIQNDGYIITNNHVIRETNQVIVSLNDARELPATVVGTDPMADIAVLKIEADNLPTLEYGDSDDLKIGEWVIAIGNPLGFEASLTVGVVSAKGRSELSLTSLEKFIQTDAAINPGNSGGPLLDLDGKVIGINTAIATRSGGYMGIGFAIPSNMAMHIVKQLINTGTVTRGFLGILPQPVNRELAQSFGLGKTEGVLIAEVIPDSPAEQAGLKQGDIIIKYNGEVVKHMGALISDIALIDPGTKISLTIFRDGKEIQVPVVIGKRPDTDEQQEQIEKSLGIEIEDLSEEIRAQLGYEKEQGVVVTKVDGRSAAASIGIRPGTLILSINRAEINSVTDFYEALKESKASRVLLLVKYGQNTRFVTLPLQEK